MFWRYLRLERSKIILFFWLRRKNAVEVYRFYEKYTNTYCYEAYMQSVTKIVKILLGILSQKLENVKFLET